MYWTHTHPHSDGDLMLAEIQAKTQEMRNAGSSGTESYLLERTCTLVDQLASAQIATLESLKELCDSLVPILVSLKDIPLMLEKYKIMYSHIEEFLDQKEAKT